jgi:hypothetical protein
MINISTSKSLIDLLPLLIVRFSLIVFHLRLIICSVMFQAASVFTPSWRILGDKLYARGPEQYRTHKNFIFNILRIRITSLHWFEDCFGPGGP